jgi:hypothetical protein
MDKKSKVLIVTFSIIVTLSIVITFYKYIVLNNINYYTDEGVFQESLLEE